MVDLSLLVVILVTATVIPWISRCDADVDGKSIQTATFHKTFTINKENSKCLVVCGRDKMCTVAHKCPQEMSQRYIRCCKTSEQMKTKIKVYYRKVIQISDHSRTAGESVSMDSSQNPTTSTVFGPQPTEHFLYRDVVTTESTTRTSLVSGSVARKKNCSVYLLRKIPVHLYDSSTMHIVDKRPAPSLRHLRDIKLNVLFGKTVFMVHGHQYKKNRIYYFGYSMEVTESTFRDNYFICAIAVWKDHDIYKNDVERELNGTWGFAFFKESGYLVAYKLTSNEKVQIARLNGHLVWTIGLYLDMYIGRFMLVTMTEKKLLLVETEIDINCPLKVAREFATDSSFSQGSSYYKWDDDTHDDTHAEVVDILKHVGNYPELCSGTKDLNLALDEAFENYPGEIEFVSATFTLGVTHTKCSIGNALWLVNIGDLSYVAPHLRKHFENFEGSQWFYSIDDVKVYYWGMALKVERPKKLVKGARTIFNIAVADYSHFDQADLERYKHARGFKFMVKTGEVLCKPFNGTQFVFKRKYWFDVSIEFVIILDKVYGRIHLIDHKENKELAMMSGVHVLSVLVNGVQYVNSTESDLTVRISYLPNADLMYSKANVIQILSKYKRI